MSTTADPKAELLGKQSSNGTGLNGHQHNMVLATKNYRVVGTRPVRHDGADKVTGRALYGADIDLAGLIHGAVLRSPHAHAKIRSIDTSEAEAMEGVYAVVTAADLPEVGDRIVDLGEGATPLSYIQGNILAKGKALYKGHAIAAVAAVNAHVAAEAAKKIKVDYEPLPASTTAPAAMAADAAILHEDLHTVELGEKTDKNSNVAEHFRYEMGDLSAGFAKADVIVEREFDTATVHQGYIEPQNATALWNNDGRLQIWSSTQGSFVVRDTTATILDLPVSQVRATPTEIGGGFGGKIPVYLEPVAALLSKKTGRPGQARHEPPRRLRGDRPHARLAHQSQDGRDQGRQIRRRPSLDGVRSGRLSGSVYRARRDVRLRLLRHRKHHNRRL